MNTYQENFLAGPMEFLSATLRSPHSSFYPPELLKCNLKTWPSLPHSALALSPSLCLGCPIPSKSLKQESPSVPAYAVKFPPPLPQGNNTGVPHAASPQRWAQLCIQHWSQVLLMLGSCRPQKENLIYPLHQVSAGNLYSLNSNQWIEKNSTYSLISISIIAPL